MHIKTILLKIAIGSALAGCGFWGGFSEGISFALVMAGYLVIGGDVLYEAASNVLHGDLFDENFLMGIATVGAFIIGESLEAIIVMLFYQIGEAFQEHAVSKSRSSITSLVEILPEFAVVLRDGTEVKVTPQEVALGELILVRAGEKIPLDGLVRKGSSSLDTKALTGESLPLDVSEGSTVRSGCINLSGLITIEVTHIYADSTVAKILDLVENAGMRKSRSERFITKFARYYTPIVVICAFLLAVVPSLLGIGIWQDWVYRGISFLVVSCPCALVISIPLGFFGGVGGAAKHGILVKGGIYIEELAKSEVVVFDKTGTLTKGEFFIQSIHPVGVSEQELLQLAATAEQHSNHPIAKSIVNSAKEPLVAVDSNEELAGFGVISQFNGNRFEVGNGRLMAQIGVEVTEDEIVGSVVHIARDGVYLGYILVSDELKSTSKTAISSLKELGIRKTVMLTGDKAQTAEKISQELGLDLVHSELLPQDKVDRLEEELVGISGKLVYVGDGINDAPVLARADVGIAMGGMGAQAAIEAADVVIMNDDPAKVGVALEISKKTMAIVKQNIALCFVVKGVVLLLATGGLSSLWEAIFADVGVAVLAILNAMRAMNYKDKRKSV